MLGAAFAPALVSLAPCCLTMAAMEIVSFGETCLRLRGKEGIVVTDPFPRIVGPTG
ncbi:MAG: hypothetical protein QOJ81_382, partial [Chloroflexota bacterium]|nr:hypothetical protein [Chloroflexota bacterium]